MTASVQNRLNINQPELNFGANQSANADQISTIGQQNLSENKKSCSCRSIIGSVMPFLPSIYSATTTATAVVALIFFIKNNESVVPLAVSLGVTASATILTIISDIYTVLKEKENKKKATIKEYERNELERQRHTEILNQIINITLLLQKYIATKDQEQFKRCVKSIKELPPASKTQPEIRSQWLSMLVELSNDEFGLKTSFYSLNNLAEKLQDQIPTRVNIATNDTGEGAAPQNNDMGDLQSLEKFRLNWEKVENTVGFPIEFIEQNGKIYQKDGMVREKSDKPALHNSSFNESTMEKIIIT